MQLVAQTSTIKCSSSCFCQEHGAKCHIFFNLLYRGHGGQAMSHMTPIMIYLFGKLFDSSFHWCIIMQKVAFEALKVTFSKKLQFLEAIGGHKSSQKPKQAQNCAVCHIFLNLVYRGHGRQAMFLYVLHHDAPIWKAGSKGFSIVGMVWHLISLWRPLAQFYYFSLR